jgi:ATP/maltotriose-dependent transcriptional regulator MalT
MHPASRGWEVVGRVSVEAERGDAYEHDAYEEGLAALESGNAAAARAAFRRSAQDGPAARALEEVGDALEDVQAAAATFGTRRRRSSYDAAWAELWRACADLAWERADAEARATAAGGLFDELGAEAGVRAAAELAELARHGSLANGPIAAMRGPVEGTPLSSREVEILRLVSQGLSNHGIAAVLVLSDHTIHRHVANILTKLGVSTRTAAVGVAARRGIL